MHAIRVLSREGGYEIVGRDAAGEEVPMDGISREFVVDSVEAALCRQGYRPPTGYRIEVEGDPQTSDPVGFPALAELVSAAVGHFGRPEAAA